MKRHLYIIPAILFFALPWNARAEETNQQTPVFHVQALDPDIDLTPLKQEGVATHSYQEVMGNREETPGDWKMLPVSLRDEILQRAGLMKTVKTWDQLDRDLLVEQARSLDISRLRNRYPRISGKLLRKLKDQLSKLEGKK